MLSWRLFVGGVGDDAEAKVDDPVVGREPEAAGRTQPRRVAAPRSAAVHAVRILLRF